MTDTGDDPRPSDDGSGERPSEVALTIAEASIPSAPGTIDLLRNGSEVYPAWLEAIARARDEILLEMYWFGSDATGRRFAEALAARAREGLDVFVLYDSIGSFGSDSSMFDALAAAGATVMEFHPIAPWRQRFRLDRITLRDHRKILVCDANVAFTGGVNICDEEAPRDRGGGGWRDDAVRIHGAAALELRALFFDTWLRIGGPSPRRGGAVARRARRAQVAAARAHALGDPRSVPERLRAIFLGLTRPSHPRFAELARSQPPSSLQTQRGTPPIQIIGHAAWGARRSIRNMYVRHVRAARERILISNSYFIPDAAVRRALVGAARRGVEVRVIVPRNSDVPSVGYASRAQYARLMQRGVHIHEWIDGMLHAKSAVIDHWATVGSYNLDYRSLRYNLEVNAASDDPSFVSQVERSMRTDLVRCVEVDPVAWHHRPWHAKLLEWLHYFVRKLL